MKRFSVFMLVLLVSSLVFGLTISCAEPEPETKILRLVIPSPAGDKLTVSAEGVGQRFYERTGGAYEIKVYPGEQLAKIPEYLDAVRTGTVEMAAVGWGTFAGMDPRLAEIPMLYNNVYANAAACGPTTEICNEIFESVLNQKALACYTTGALEVESKKPVKTMDDWKGLLIGCPNPEVAALATSLGASPVVMMWTEAYASLEKGVVDACFNSTQWTIISKLTDVTSYVTLFYPGPTFFGYTINLDIWKAMPKDMQDILIEEAQKASQDMSEAHFKADKEDADILASLGMDVYRLPKAERDKWKEAVRPYVDEKLGAMGEFGDRLRAIAEEANKANPYPY